MLLRAALTCSALWLFSFGAVAAEPCACDGLKDTGLSAASAELTRPQFEPEPLNRSNDNSSFRGLSLGMSKAEAQEALQPLGFLLMSYSPQSNAKDICKGETSVGTVRFDQQGQIHKLELNPFYFAVGKIVLREFADGIFDHFKVRPISTSDDVCFQDVTCFRGTTFTEQFLILRIAEDVQLHISKKRAGSGLTQR